MKRALINGKPMPQLYYVNVPLLFRKSASGLPEVVYRDVPILLPSAILKWAFDYHPRKFYTHFVGSNDHASTMNFWKNTRHDDDLAWTHPAAQDPSPEAMKWVIPFGSHGDGVPISRPGAGSASLTVVSGSSLVAEGGTIDTHWVHFVAPSFLQVKKNTRGSLTTEPMWKAFAWDLESNCATGKFSFRDENNRPFAPNSPRGILAGEDIAGGHKLQHMFNRADLEFHSNEMRLPHWSCKLPCMKCPADKRVSLWTDWDGSWRFSSYSDLSWEAPDHPLYQVSWACPRMNAVDPSHTISKGVAEYALGSLFHDVVYNKELAPRGTIAMQVDVLNAMLEAWYREQKVRAQVRGINLKELCDPSKPYQDYPCYSAGSMSKTKALIPFGLHVARQFCTSEVHEHRHAMFENLVQITEIIYRGPDHLPADMVTKLNDCIDRFLRHYSFLNWEARSRKKLSYHVVYKFHYLVHVGQEAKWINPRVGGCCMQDEDFMGRMAALCKGCLKGRAAIDTIDGVMQQYLRAMVVRWSAASSSA